jgi:hypothetical protein
MTYKESIVRGRIQSEHAVQLFDSPESLAQTVAGILASRHAEGDDLLVVAKRANWSAVATCLAEGGVDADRLIRSRRLTVLDAAETLDAISRRDVPDPELFENVVGTLVRERSADRPLTIYGEMVELLAAEADFASALKLEDLWNDLSERCSFRLLCGYSAAHFTAPGHDRTLGRVCAAHTSVHAAAADPLAAWLVRLTRAPLRLAHSRR